MNVGTIARHLEQFFAERNQQLAVIGGYGLIAYGIERATFDLDLLVETEVQDELIAFLESLGYATLHRSAGYSNHLHSSAELGRLDFVYADKDTAHRVFAAAEIRPIVGDLLLPVPRPEHLIAMKVQAIKNDPTRRLQDLADIQRLARLPNTDRVEVRGYFDRLGLEALFNELEIDG